MRLLSAGLTAVCAAQAPKARDPSELQVYLYPTAPKDVYEENEITLEVRPIFEWSSDRVVLTVNPVGVGVGATDPGNTLVHKMRFGWMW